MTEETGQEPKYRIEDGGVVEGRPMKRVVKNDDEGNLIFNIGAEFTDEQIDEVYFLCDGFFINGINYGVRRVQSDNRRVQGLPDFDQLINHINSLTAKVNELSGEKSEGVAEQGPDEVISEVIESAKSSRGRRNR